MVSINIMREKRENRDDFCKVGSYSTAIATVTGIATSMVILQSLLDLKFNHAVCIVLFALTQIRIAAASKVLGWHSQTLLI